MSTDNHENLAGLGYIPLLTAVHTRDGYLDEDPSIWEDYISDIRDEFATSKIAPWALLASRPNSDWFVIDLSRTDWGSRMRTANLRTVHGLFFPDWAA